MGSNIFFWGFFGYRYQIICLHPYFPPYTFIPIIDSWKCWLVYMADFFQLLSR